MLNKSSRTIDLNKVGIASPCTMNWERMQGDARVRHCGDCKLNVFNVAELSKAEAEALIAKTLKGERVCVRLQRREDGTIITKDCPTGARRVRRRRYGISAACAAFFAFMLGAFNPRSRADEAIMMGAPIARQVPEGETLMGDMAVDPETQNTLGGLPVIPVDSEGKPIQTKPTKPGGKKPTQNPHRREFLGKMKVD